MNQRIKRGAKWGVIGVLGWLVLSACATRVGTALDESTHNRQIAQEAVYLMTLSLDNAYRPVLPLYLSVLHIERDGGRRKEDRINVSVVNQQSQIELPTPGRHYLLSFSLPPGQYEILGASAAAGIFPMVAHFFAPLHADLTVTAPGIFYLGHMQATVRERQGDEFRAGPLFSPAQQVLAGASTGTFDVQVTDQMVRDEALFRQRFEALRTAHMVKAVLPPFDRARAQSHWEKR